MVNKNKGEDLYSIWYNMSTEMGKQLLDITKAGNLDYGAFHDSWKDYSMKFGEKMSELLSVDENYYKNIVTLWNDFTETMNSHIPNLNVYDKTTYDKWYEYWLEYIDKINTRLTKTMEQQIKHQTELSELNEVWMDKFGISDKYKQQIKEVTKIMTDYWLDVGNKATELFKESMQIDNDGKSYMKKYQELYEYWTEAYSNMVKSVMETPAFESWNELDLDKNLKDFKKLQEYFNDYLNNFKIFDQQYFNKIYEELQELKTQVESLYTDWEYKNKSSGSKKKR